MKKVDFANWMASFLPTRNSLVLFLSPSSVDCTAAVLLYVIARTKLALQCGYGCQCPCVLALYVISFKCLTWRINLSAMAHEKCLKKNKTILILQRGSNHTPEVHLLPSHKEGGVALSHFDYIQAVTYVSSLLYILQIQLMSGRCFPAFALALPSNPSGVVQFSFLKLISTTQLLIWLNWGAFIANFYFNFDSNYWYHQF